MLGKKGTIADLQMTDDGDPSTEDIALPMITINRFFLDHILRHTILIPASPPSEPTRTLIFPQDTEASSAAEDESMQQDQTFVEDSMPDSVASCASPEDSSDLNPKHLRLPPSSPLGISPPKFAGPGMGLIKYSGAVKRKEVDEADEDVFGTEEAIKRARLEQTLEAPQDEDAMEAINEFTQVTTYQQEQDEDIEMTENAAQQETQCVHSGYPDVQPYYQSQDAPYIASSPPNPVYPSTHHYTHDVKPASQDDDMVP